MHPADAIAPRRQAQTLYEIAAQYREATDVLADLDADPQAIHDTLEGLRGTLEAKVTNVGYVIRNAESLADQIDEAIATLKKRSASLRKRGEWLRVYVLDNMQLSRTLKVTGPYLSLAVRANPVKVDVYDVRQVPAGYMRHPEPPPPEPDKALIRDALQHGKDVPGARLTMSSRVDIT